MLCMLALPSALIPELPAVTSAPAALRLELTSPAPLDHAAALRPELTLTIFDVPLQSAPNLPPPTLHPKLYHRLLTRSKRHVVALAGPPTTRTIPPRHPNRRGTKADRVHQRPHQPPTASKSHLQIGQELKLLDFASAGTVTGRGWYYLLNEAVLLEQALVNYSLSLARSVGFTLVTSPNLVYSHIASACGSLPRDHHGQQQSYLTSDGKHVLAGTAEIPSRE